MKTKTVTTLSDVAIEYTERAKICRRIYPDANPTSFFSRYKQLYHAKINYQKLVASEGRVLFLMSKIEKP